MVNNFHWAENFKGCCFDPLSLSMKWQLIFETLVLILKHSCLPHFFVLFGVRNSSIYRSKFCKVVFHLVVLSYPTINLLYTASWGVFVQQNQLGAYHQRPGSNCLMASGCREQFGIVRHFPGSGRSKAWWGIMGWMWQVDCDPTVLVTLVEIMNRLSLITRPNSR